MLDRWFGTDLIGLSHTCTGSKCKNNVLFCVDSTKATLKAALCSVTCATKDSCSGSTIVVANSGGLQLQCLKNRACKGALIQWVNSDNIADYSAFYATATKGGALRSLDCIGTDSCKGIRVKGQTQDSGRNALTNWNCVGRNSCQSAVVDFRGTLSLQCVGQHSCDDFSLRCLRGGHCHTTVDSATAANRASLICTDDDVNSCDSVDGIFTRVILEAKNDELYSLDSGWNTTYRPSEHPKKESGSDELISDYMFGILLPFAVIFCVLVIVKIVFVRDSALRKKRLKEIATENAERRERVHSDADSIVSALYRNVTDNIGTDETPPPVTSSSESCGHRVDKYRPHAHSEPVPSGTITLTIEDRHVSWDQAKDSPISTSVESETEY